jgi:dienelactone hydrolase
MRRAALAAAFTLLACASAQAQQRESISFESRQKGQPVQVMAEIYWPAAAGPVPALVIHHGSGGVGERESRFAREMVAMGVAAVVIDSFRPRGVSSTVQDQSAVNGQDFNFDALMALKALGGNSRINRTRIGITGFSKGGTSSLMAALEAQVVAAGIPAGLRYALHVPFYPSCSTQYSRLQTTGAPVYMLLGGADTYAGVEPCQTYGNALRAAGGRVEVTVFPNAPHGFDGGRPYFDPRGENYAKCVFQQQADRSWIERASGVMTIGTDGRPIQGALAKALAVCRTLGTSGGPNDAAAKQSMDDLKGYVRRHLLGG